MAELTALEEHFRSIISQQERRLAEMLSRFQKAVEEDLSSFSGKSYAGETGDFFDRFAENHFFYEEKTMLARVGLRRLAEVADQDETVKKAKMQEYAKHLEDALVTKSLHPLRSTNVVSNLRHQQQVSAHADVLRDVTAFLKD